MSNSIPDIAPTIYNIPSILKFSFKFLFTLNSTNKPTPEFTSKPAIIEPIVIMFSRNNSVKITELAQFGIIPIKDAKIGPTNGVLTNRPAILSSPIPCIIIFNIKLITNMYANI